MSPETNPLAQEIVFRKTNVHTGRRIAVSPAHSAMRHLAVLMPSGFQPNVSVPGYRVSFLWAMAAHRERADRQFGVVNLQHGFAQHQSGLEAGRKKSR
jgi:hypothetical protein